MTTHVPEGTPERTVDDVRGREAERARELAAEGSLLRLWRAPLEPEPWRTLGLFAANSHDHLDKVLRSMPLQIWRTDDVEPLQHHPNDPGPLRETRGSHVRTPEFLTVFKVCVPEGTPETAIRVTRAREARRAHDLAEEGHLLRLWNESSPSARALGLWQAPDGEQMQAILESLPMDPWMSVETTPLFEHPSDPELESRSHAAP